MGNYMKSKNELKQYKSNLPNPKITGRMTSYVDFSNKYIS